MAAELGEQLLLLSLAQSAAVTEDAVEPISTCNRLEVLDLQSTKIGVKSSLQKLVAGIKTVFPRRPVFPHCWLACLYFTS